MKLSKKILLMALLTICALHSIIGYSEDKQKIIKIAILDNFHFQQNITNEYDKYYLLGIDVAKFSALKKGFKIEYKVFRYSKGPLAILSVIPEIDRWHPDVIIGPRNSNMFLTIKDSFKNILVLSPFATSSDIQKMPKNYYSLTLPDSYMAKAISIFIERHYPKNDIFSIVEADCKNCVDISQELGTIYHKDLAKKEYTENLYLQDSVKKVDIQKILKGYKSTNIIFLPNTSYSTAILMVRITNYLKRPMFYIGGDDWGNWRNTEVGKLNADLPYYGIHVTPWSLDVNSKNSNDFSNNYRQMYNEEPVDASTLLAYTTILSIIDALNKFDDSTISDMKTRILSSYTKALAKDKNWYRPSVFVFYKTDNNRDVPIDRVSIY